MSSKNYKFNSFRFLFLPLIAAFVSACEPRCKPSNCETAQLVFEALLPITNELTNFDTKNEQLPRKLNTLLNEATGVDFSTSVELKQVLGSQSTFILSSSRISDDVFVFYFFEEQELNFYFRYRADSGVHTCFWRNDRSVWSCLRR